MAVRNIGSWALSHSEQESSSLPDLVVNSSVGEQSSLESLIHVVHQDSEEESNEEECSDNESGDNIIDEANKEQPVCGWRPPDGVTKQSGHGW